VPDAPSYLVYAALMFAAAGTQGFLGFGYGIIVMAWLTLTNDLVHATAVVNLSSLLLVAAVVGRDYRHILWLQLRRIVPAMFVGIAVGLVALGSIERALMVRTLGVVIIAIAAWNLWGPPLRRHRESLPRDMAFGLASGVLSGAFNTGGPPLVIHLYRRPEPPVQLVVTLQAIFVCSGVVRALMATSQGLIGRAAVYDTLWAAPWVVLGALAGRRLGARTDPLRFRRIAWLALGALGVALLAGS